MRELMWPVGSETQWIEILVSIEYSSLETQNTLKGYYHLRFS